MEKGLIVQLNRTFEESAYTRNKVEYWMARDLQKLLDYDEWRNFLKVIDKARTACKTAGYEAADHFPDIRKMVSLGSGAQREIDDVALTRYACYLIAQNADKRVYFVAETKGANKINDLSLSAGERYKIKCGFKHFRELSEVEFKAPVTSFGEIIG
jgi:DNA-damage-inducible protein D